MVKPYIILGVGILRGRLQFLCLSAIAPLTWLVHLLIHQISMHSCITLSPGDGPENKIDIVPTLMDLTKTIRNNSVVTYWDRLWQDNKQRRWGRYCMGWGDLIWGEGEGGPLWTSKGSVIKGVWVCAWRSGWEVFHTEGTAHANVLGQGRGGGVGGNEERPMSWHAAVGGEGVRMGFGDLF